MSTLNNLIEQEVRKVLREASYTEADIPKVFWMVTSVDEHSEDTLEQLATGELVGVKGISDTKEIVVQWLGVARNAVLVIPAKKFLEVNNVSRVMYDNPHYLVSKGMAALFRLFNRSPENDYDWTGLMQTVMDYVKAQGKKSEQASKPMATVLYNIDYGTLAPSWYGRAYKTEKPSINTLKDLTAWIHKATIKIANDNEKHIVKDAELLTLDDWMPLVEKALKAIGATYRSEGEWFVKDDAMSVPKDSILFIGVDVDPKTISDEAREEFAQDPDPRSHVNGWPTPQMVQEKQALEIMALAKRYGLENHYRLKFISMKKFDAYKKKFWTRKSKQ